MTDSEIRDQVLTLDAEYHDATGRPAYIRGLRGGGAEFDGGHQEDTWPGALQHMRRLIAGRA